MHINSDQNLHPSRRLKNAFVLLLLTVFVAPAAFSQLVGTDVFLQGNFHQVGLSQCGVYGSNNPPFATMGPFGPYFPTEAGGLGFVADADEDGWTVGPGNDYCGDYFVPGSPVEGWSINIPGYTALINTDQPCNSYDIPGSITSFVDAGAVQTAVWEGTATFPGGETVDIIQTTIMPTDKLYFVTQLTFCNTGTVPITDFYYSRNVDPDNDQPWSGSFVTFNEVVSQPPMDPEALVTAEGTTFGCFIGMGARDTMARVTFNNFNTGDPIDVWNFTGGYIGSGTQNADQAISIAYRALSIDTGECVCFAFAYILDEDDLDDALDATTSVGVLADGIDISSTAEVVICGPEDSTVLELLGPDEFEWTWTPPIGLSTDTGSVVVAAPDTTTVYTAVGVSENCGTAFREITVIVETGFLGVDAGEDKFICPGESVVLDGSGAFSYSWDPPTGLDNPNASNPVASPSVTTTYYLTGLTETGCPGSDSTTVTVWDLPTVTIDPVGATVDICIGSSTVLTASGAVDYVWSPADGLDVTIGESVTASPEVTTTYTVVGTDANGCENTSTITVVVNPLPIADAGADITIDIVNNDVAVLTATGGVSYTWTPITGIQPPSDPNQASISVQPEDTTTYIVMVTDANGCVSFDSVTVNVIGDYEVYLPTAFSPNNDGQNDIYRPYIIGQSADRGLVRWEIYNRWGELVYSATDQFAGWNGEFKGTQQDMGSYVVIVLSRVMGQDVVNRETFHLVR